jgi:hypothetical protein
MIKRGTPTTNSIISLSAIHVEARTRDRVTGCCIIASPNGKQNGSELSPDALVAEEELDRIHNAVDDTVQVYQLPWTLMWVHRHAAPGRNASAR